MSEQKKMEQPQTDTQPQAQRGHVLLATLMVILILTLLGMTSLYLAGQDVPGLSALKEESGAQQLAEAAAELVVTWFHDPVATPPVVMGAFTKRQGDEASGPSYFDAAGRSQFVGTADRPDILLDAANPEDNNLLNNPPSGFPGTLRALGRLARIKLYGPIQTGLLGTLEVTATTVGPRPIARTVQVQLGALTIPPIRAAVQVGRNLGTAQPAGESPVSVHWGDQRIVGDLVVKKMERVTMKTSSAAVTGLPYDLTEQALDRWSNYWIGGELTVTAPPPGQGIHPVPPSNVHIHQLPAPGVRLDQWDYNAIKKASLRHGTYYRLDRQGRLHSQETLDGEGVVPSDVLKSQAMGDHRGLVFIDTTDGEPPRSDNMGTLVLEADYLESLLVVQGHVVLKPVGAGHSVPVLSPSPEGTNGLAARIPVQLSGIHLQGLLWTAGLVTVERAVRMFGAVVSGEGIVAAGGTTLEVWYNPDLALGSFRGLPVVFRVPGTWRLL